MADPLGKWLGGDKRVMNTWKTVYDEGYLALFDSILDRDRTRGEVDFLEEIAGLPPGYEVLDLACGNGRHAIELARRGYRVLALDQSERLLALARERAAAAGVEVEFVRGDMREIPDDRTFGAVISLFQSFGYLESWLEHQRLIDGVAKGLSPDGVFVLDVVNPLGLAAELLPHAHEDGARLSRPPRQYVSGGRWLEESEVLDAARMRWSTRVCSVDDGQELFALDVQLFTPAEIDRLAGHAALVTKARYGDCYGSPFTFSSRRQVVVLGHQSDDARW